MGILTPTEAAPAYNDVFSDHPVNKYSPSGPTSEYATVPQDDVELQEHDHNHHEHASLSSAPAETLAQTIAGVFRPKTHVHCEQCDVQTAARQRRENERHCCNMVAATFMTLIICGMLLGIVVVVHVLKKARHDHD
ncbi:hypothetical protein ACN47E_008535 [Coniothyrium glycines]